MLPPIPCHATSHLVPWSIPSHATPHPHGARFSPSRGSHSALLVHDAPGLVSGCALPLLVNNNCTRLVSLRPTRLSAPDSPPCTRPGHLSASGWGVVASLTTHLTASHLIPLLKHLLSKLRIRIMARKSMLQRSRLHDRRRLPSPVQVPNHVLRKP
ncbi:uncharacterized protein SCHCODRAFT_02102242 [Schizophyllum commune H4-8]|uniref:uncharacterized protein n=1 Tax=Schizophyllum commune (strain H4-8 / FGSC 9210) TaxID=578458 RepID=UPI00215FA96C|nr:uncharacterized protein SCHCODRAFT_02102242 [Schizophyllum commune H4-8]KAI5886612.1 hypothetical protein SCHCODRAFT_02102242 [Schizophyllum commune H4-8]